MTNEQKSVHFIEVLNGEIVKRIDTLMTKINSLEMKIDHYLPYNKESVASDELLLRDLRETHDYVSRIRESINQLEDSFNETDELLSDANNKLINIIFPLEDKIKKKKEGKWK